MYNSHYSRTLVRIYTQTHSQRNFGLRFTDSDNIEVSRILANEWFSFSFRLCVEYNYYYVYDATNNNNIWLYTLWSYIGVYIVRIQWLVTYSIQYSEEEEEGKK